MKVKTFPQVKRQLDKVFGEYIRKRDEGKPCISCGQKMVPLQCGHYFSRNHFAIRWNEMNAAGQCARCNAFLQGNAQGFREGLILRYGEDAVKRLEMIAKISVKHSASDLSWMIEHYKQKIKELE